MPVQWHAPVFTAALNISTGDWAFLSPEAQKEALAKQSYFSYRPNTIVTAARLRKELQFIKSQGLALDREEHEPGIICIAVPIISSKGAVLRGTSMNTTTQLHSLCSLKNVREQLVKASEEISETTENWQFPT